MNKELIELQRGCKATCVIILDENYKNLDSSIIMESNIDNKYLFANPIGNPIFREKLEKTASASDTAYFIIRNISSLDYINQNRYIGLVKDREFLGYKLPANVIIAFTVNSSEELKNISKELYHFCVVAF